MHLPDHPDVFSSHHRQHAVPDLLPAGVVVAGAPARDAVVGCQLVGGGLMVAATLGADTVVRHQRHHLAHVAADDINVVIVLDGSAACRMLVLRLSFRRFCNGQGSKFSDFRVALGRRDSPLCLAVSQYVLPSLGDSALATVAHAEQAFIALIAAVYAEASHAPEAPCNSAIQAWPTCARRWPTPAASAPSSNRCSTSRSSRSRPLTTAWPNSTASK